jgi:sulfite reductase alpha subunit-like flavoprotein
VSVVSYTTPHGVVRKGICTNYLQQAVPALTQDGQKRDTRWKRNPSVVRLFVSPNSHFRLFGQENLTSALTPKVGTRGDSHLPLDTPLLMLAIGSGIAPFRSFWQELQVLERRQGSVQVERVLFMGCRSANDFLYANELRGLTSSNNRKDKLLSAVIPVFSRENTNGRRYIQDAILEHDRLVYSMLTKKNALIYMCGSTRSCQGLEAALGSIMQLSSPKSLTQTEAMDVIKQLKESGRIRQDMFG